MYYSMALRLVKKRMGAEKEAKAGLTRFLRICPAHCEATCPCKKEASASTKKFLT